MEHIRKFIRLIFSNKLKIALTLFATVVFLILLFPLDDINDLVTSEVAKNTGNQVYVQFEHMDLSFLPTPGVSLDQLSLEMAQLAPLSIRRLEVRPSLLGLLLQKIDAEADAEGLFRGDVRASIKPGKKMENGAMAQAISIKAERINLADLRKFANLPLDLRGQLNLTADGQVDLAFTNQPDITVDLQSPSFDLAPTTMELPMGPVSLPDLKLNRLQVKGRLSAGQFLLEEALIGREGDEMVGSIKGKLGLELRNLGNGRVVPVASNYEFNVNLLIKKSLEDRAKLFLMIIESHRQPEGENGRYRFVLTGNAQNQQFNFSPAR